MSPELKKVDARGISCPQPVLLAKKALEESPAGLEIRVDNTTAKGNVERFVKNLGYSVAAVAHGDEFIITATKKP